MFQNRLQEGVFKMVSDFCQIKVMSAWLQVNEIKFLHKRPIYYVLVYKQLLLKDIKSLFVSSHTW